jgi:hypothetical protein
VTGPCTASRSGTRASREALALALALALLTVIRMVWIPAQHWGYLALLFDGFCTQSSAGRIALSASCCYLAILLSVLTTLSVFLSVLTTFASVLSWFHWSKLIGRRVAPADVAGIGALA